MLTKIHAFYSSSLFIVSHISDKVHVVSFFESLLHVNVQ